MQALRSLGAASGSCVALAGRLQALFRVEPVASVDGLPPAPAWETVQLSPASVAQALRGGGRGSAPGLSGWRFEHFRPVLQLPGGVDKFTASLEEFSFAPRSTRTDRLFGIKCIDGINCSASTRIEATCWSLPNASKKSAG